MSLSSTGETVRVIVGWSLGVVVPRDAAAFPAVDYCADTEARWEVEIAWRLDSTGSPGAPCLHSELICCICGEVAKALA